MSHCDFVLPTSKGLLPPWKRNWTLSIELPFQSVHFLCITQYRRSRPSFVDRRVRTQNPFEILLRRGQIWAAQDVAVALNNATIDQFLAVPYARKLAGLHDSLFETNSNFSLIWARHTVIFTAVFLYRKGAQSGAKGTIKMCGLCAMPLKVNITHWDCSIAWLHCSGYCLLWYFGSKKTTFCIFSWPQECLGNRYPLYLQLTYIFLHHFRPTSSGKMPSPGASPAGAGGGGSFSNGVRKRVSRGCQWTDCQTFWNCKSQNGAQQISLFLFKLFPLSKENSLRCCDRILTKAAGWKRTPFSPIPHSVKRLPSVY